MGYSSTKSSQFSTEKLIIDGLYVVLLSIETFKYETTVSVYMTLPVMNVFPPKRVLLREKNVSLTSRFPDISILLFKNTFPLFIWTTY